MRALRYILPLLTAALLLSSCRTISTARKEKVQQEESDRLVHTLMEEAPVNELTASLSFNLQGTKVSGQLRMRRSRSIQISANMLGLMEVARIEFLPDMVVVMDRVHNLYSVCHYADIPYRNELGLDFEVVQALLWNRIFSPGSESMNDAVSNLRLQPVAQDGTISIKDKEYGYTFLTDGKSRLDAVSKTCSTFRFNMKYTDFTALSGKWQFPLGLSIDVITTKVDVNAAIKMSSVQTDNKNWSDRTPVTRRMKQVTLDELLDNLNL